MGSPGRSRETPRAQTSEVSEGDIGNKIALIVLVLASKGAL